MERPVKMNKSISPRALEIIRRMQRNEVTEAAVYRAIAAHTRDNKNKQVLHRLAAEEERHAKIWESYTGEQMRPRALHVLWRKFCAIVLGFSFTIKLMEKGERGAGEIYAALYTEVAQAKAIEMEENAHERELIELLDEERLNYVGSMVLGLNDALVELTGTLAGLTLAMQNTKLIALSGLITGISATLSMASSEFLSAKSEGKKDALKSCAYTGAAYLVTVALLILPYLLFDPAHYLYALAWMLGTVVLIIVAFNYYLAVAKDLSFKTRFFEMAGVSLGVAALSFAVGLLVKKFLGIDL